MGVPVSIPGLGHPKTMRIELSKEQQHLLRKASDSREHVAIVTLENGTIFIETGDFKELVELKFACDTGYTEMLSCDLHLRPI